jgi:acetoin utilization deacetylase AcuC-like enzyme
MTLLYSDPLFLRHETGAHPECPQRLTAVLQRLQQSGLAGRCERGEFTPLATDEIAQVHEPNLIALARRVAEQGGGRLDPDTVVSPASFDVARAAAGACAAAVSAVVAGRDRTALCLVRPPGHHATRTHSMGFCLFDNIALAAHHARAVHGLSRLLIVDWDVHHGNGTQDIFYADPGVFFLSIHRYGHGFYPGTGAADETGTGPGLGATVNVPIRHGTPRQTFLDLFTLALEKAADRIRPELVLVSAGFDAHRDDPIGSLELDTEDFSTLTRRVLDIADVHASGRVVSCLEGGYNLDALAASVQVHLEGLLAQNDRPC